MGRCNTRITHPNIGYGGTGPGLDPVRDPLRLYDPRVAAPLLAILAAGAGENNVDIVQALTAISPKAVSPLLEALHGANARVRAGAAVALGHCHNAKAVPPLLNALHDADAQVRYGAVTSLGTLGDVRAVPPLIALLHCKDLACVCA